MKGILGILLVVLAAYLLYDVFAGKTGTIFNVLKGTTETTSTEQAKLGVSGA